MHLFVNLWAIQEDRVGLALLPKPLYGVYCPALHIAAVGYIIIARLQ